MVTKALLPILLGAAACADVLVPVPVSERGRGEWLTSEERATLVASQKTGTTTVTAVEARMRKMAPQVIMGEPGPKEIRHLSFVPGAAGVNPIYREMPDVPAIFTVNMFVGREEYGDVRAYSDLFVNMNRKQLPDDQVEHRPEGFYLVAWKDGRVTRVPVADVRITLKPGLNGSKDGRPFFPGTPGYADAKHRLPQFGDSDAP